MGNLAKIYICATNSTSTTGTGIATTGGAVGDEYHFLVAAVDRAKRFWDPSKAVTVKKDGVANTGFKRIVYPGGRVVYSTNPTGVITVDAFYFTVSVLGEAKEWSIDLEQDVEDVTTLGKTWKEYQPLLKGASGSLGKWFVDSTFVNHLTSATLIGLSLETTSGESFDLYARFTGASISAAVDGFVEESLDFTVMGELSPPQ